MILPQISIIIPVYNVEPYLHQCIDSILNQTYKDWECILVDDGSTDSSGVICDEYAVKDSRIHVLHTENCGASHARNIGIECANGEWISFVDADDWISPDAMSYMLHRVQEYNADVCLCMMDINVPNTNRTQILTSNDKIELIWSCLSFNTNRYTKEGFLIDSPWAKLYHNTIIQEKKLRFIAGLSRSEDAIFDAYFYHYAKRIIMDSHIVYYYTSNPNSTCHSINLHLPNTLEQVLNEEKNFVDTFYKEDSYFNTALYVRSFKGLNQILYQNGLHTLNIQLHSKILKEYLNSNIVHNSLLHLSHKMLSSCSHNFIDMIELFFAKNKCAFLAICTMRIKVHLVKFIKYVCGIDQNKSLRSFISK